MFQNNELISKLKISQNKNNKPRENKKTNHCYKTIYLVEKKLRI